MEIRLSKVLLPDASKVQDIVIPIPMYAIPQVKPKGDMSAKEIDRKTMQDVYREIPIYTDPVYGPPPKSVKHLYLMFLESYQILTQN